MDTLSVFSDDRDVGVQMVVLTILLLVAALTATLGGPDDALERTAGLPWPPRRVAHLLVAFLVVAVSLLATLATGARFGPDRFRLREHIGRILTWQAQPPGSTAAAVTAGLLAFGGLIAYAVAGPAPRAPAEAAQQ